MYKSNPLDTELFLFSKYKAAHIARNYLLITLSILGLIYIYKGYSTTPIYIVVLLFFVPLIMSTKNKQLKEPKFQLSYIKYKLDYSKQHSINLRVHHLVATLLLYVWWVHLLHTSPSVLKRSVPLILIISDLLIITIGRYYYFFKFRSYLLLNKADQIK